MTDDDPKDALAFGEACELAFSEAPTPPPKRRRRSKRKAVDADASRIEPHWLSDHERVYRAVYDEAVERAMLAGLRRREAEREASSMAAAVTDRLRLAGVASTGTPPAFYDLRGEQDYVYPGGRRKARLVAPGVPARRHPATVDTIVVHQTAAEYGVSMRAVKAAGGDVDLARARRALDVACHAMAFRAGYFVAAHDLDVYVNHANRFNRRSLGLEIEGRYPGLMDRPATVAREDLSTTWGDVEPTKLTDTTVKAACDALAWLVREGRKAGMPIRRIVAHRQSSNTRRADPGEEIWRRVVLACGVQELGLEADRRAPWNEGRPIPKAWDPEGTGAY